MELNIELLNRIKDEISFKNGYGTWKELVDYHNDSGLHNEIVPDFIDEVCRRYAEEMNEELISIGKSKADKLIQIDRLYQYSLKNANFWEEEWKVSNKHLVDAFNEAQLHYKEYRDKISELEAEITRLKESREKSIVASLEKAADAAINRVGYESSVIRESITNLYNITIIE